MALPSSGKITLSMIAAEFGGSAPHRLSEYYRGGANVPNITTNNGIPTGGAIAFSDFYGATAYVPMSNPTLSTTSVTIKRAAADAGVNCSTGTISCSTPSGGSGNKTYTWERVSGQTLSVSGGQNATLSRTATGTITTSVYRCRVTDATGASVISNTVTLNFYHYRLYGAAVVNRSASNTGAVATAQLLFRRDGSAQSWQGDQWVAPASATVGDDFEIIFTNDNSVSGDNADISAAYTVPDPGVWARINQNFRNGAGVERRQSSYGSSAAGVRVRLRLAGQSVALDKSVLLSATMYSSMGMGMGGGMGGPLL